MVVVGVNQGEGLFEGGGLIGRKGILKKVNPKLNYTVMIS